VTPTLVRRKLEALIWRAGLPLRSRTWSPYSQLLLADDGVDWVLANETREVGRIARSLGIKVPSNSRATGVRRQSVFYASQFVLLDERHFDGDNRVAITYFHGRPTPEEPTFERCHDALRRRHVSIARIQVSHSDIRDLVLSAGVDAAKVHVIPIGVRVEWFPMRTNASSATARDRLGIPRSATVVGSLQKDGIGWREGEEPKLIKGPDVFLEVIGRLKAEVPELFVLLSGPARGFVRHGLERLGVPYRHVYPPRYRDVGGLYQALDAYVISSRQEGGPKAVLESMASGVPLVTTRVGQAMDLVETGRNGWMVEVEDVDGLVASTLCALRADEALIAAARRTAEDNRYEAQRPLWERFFRGFVDF